MSTTFSGHTVESLQHVRWSASVFTSTERKVSEVERLDCPIAVLVVDNKSYPRTVRGRQCGLHYVITLVTSSSLQHRVTSPS